MRKQNSSGLCHLSGTYKAIVLGLLVGCLLGFTFISSVEKVSCAPSSCILKLRLIHRSFGLGGQVRRIDDLLKEVAFTFLLEVGGPDNQIPGRQDEKQLSLSKSSQGVEQTSIHTLCTSNGSPYLNFQTRIMYGTYKMVQKMPGGENMVAFTRILHRTAPDAVMREIPTFRADPLTPHCDTWCEFPVSDRPNAVAQFFKAADSDPSMIKAPWLLMLEGDYVWMKPLPTPRADSDSPSWAFPYSYIAPQAAHLQPVMRLMYPESEGPLSNIPNSGPAPVLMREQEWRKVVPDWERLAAHIEAHKATKDALGWVREMYAWSIAAALQGIKLELMPPAQSPLIAQPPHDKSIGNASMLHYTWGTLVEEGGTKLWTFDKREYIAAEFEKQVPLIPLPPLFKEGLMLHEGSPYDRQLHETTLAMLKQMNRAIVDLPTL